MLTQGSCRRYSPSPPWGEGGALAPGEGAAPAPAPARPLTLPSPREGEETTATPEFERLRREFQWRIEDHATRREADGVWVTGRGDAVSYPDEGHAVCASVEDHSFWFRHRNQIIERLLRGAGLPAALWEIGSGNGFVARHLMDAGIAVVAVEPGPGGARRAAERGIAQSVCGFMEDLKLPDASLPAIGCFDVLEHLEKPEVLLREFFRVLKPGGIAAISVPALQFLWSSADDVAGHFRRYSRRSANSLMAAAGFACVKSGYRMACMVPPLFLFRSLPYKLGRRQSREQCMAEIARQLAPKSRPLAFLMESVLAMELKAGGILALPCGTSLIGVYRKAT